MKTNKETPGLKKGICLLVLVEALSPHAYCAHLQTEGSKSEPTPLAVSPISPPR